MAGLKATAISATTAAVTNRLVASANMKVGAYTLANSGVAAWAGGFKVTVTHTEVGGGVDTLGTIVFVGKGLHGEALTETLTPVQDSTVTGSVIFKSVTSVTGVGWAIGTGNDTIVCGVAADSYAAVGGGYIDTLIVLNVVATAFSLSDAGMTLTYPASLPVGSYKIGVPFSGFLKIATTSTNNIEVIHSTGVPTTYAMA